MLLGTEYRQIVTLIISQLMKSALQTNTSFFSSMPICLAVTQNPQLSPPLTFTIFSMKGLMIIGICVMYGIFKKGCVVGVTTRFLLFCF